MTKKLTMLEIMKRYMDERTPRPRWTPGELALINGLQYVQLDLGGPERPTLADVGAP